MLGNLKPYTEYKDSGASWLGAVPACWDVVPAFGLYVPKLVKNTGMSETRVLSLSYGHIVVKPEAKLHGLVPASFESYQIIEPGDIVIRTTDLQNDRTSLRVGLSRLRGIITSAYLCVRARPGILPEFAYLLLHAYDLLKVLYGYGSGLRQNLEFTDIKRMPGVIPPLSEQTAIVRFLDHVDQRIRRYIAVKKKLIALLIEQKEAIIHRAVTRGLDPNVRFRDSGITWLRELPEHWNVVPFKRQVGFQEGPGIMATDFRDAGVPLLRISCLRNEHATLNGCNFLDPEMVKRRWSHFAVRPGDYLLSASGSTGSVSLATEQVAGAIPYTGILRLWALSPETYMPFVRLFMTCRPFQDQIDAAKCGVAIEHFGPTHLKRMVISVPPIDEQREIVAFVEHRTAAFGPVLAAAARQIDLAREYRTRLIADVVTGKFDVREAAAHLPEEPVEAEPVEEAEPLDERENEEIEGSMEEVEA